MDENNRVRLVIGAAGGTKSTTAIATAMILNLLLDYNIKQAIDARRIHHQVRLVAERIMNAHQLFGAKIKKLYFYFPVITNGDQLREKVQRNNLVISKGNRSRNYIV